MLFLVAFSLLPGNPQLKLEEAGLRGWLVCTRALHWVVACRAAWLSTFPALSHRPLKAALTCRPPASQLRDLRHRAVSSFKLRRGVCPQKLCSQLVFPRPVSVAGFGGGFLSDPPRGQARSSCTSVTEVRLARATSCSASVCGLGETSRMSSPFHLPPRTHEISRDEHLTQVPAGCVVFEGFQVPGAEHSALNRRYLPIAAP